MMHHFTVVLFLFLILTLLQASAATTATIVSGTLAERCTLTTYLTLSLCNIGFIYPVVVQMAWGDNGLFSPWLGSDDKKDYFLECGVIDFAGGGVGHMTAGVAALTGAVFMGPRKSFVNGTNMTPPYGPIFQTLGTLILWFGWYGLNGGSILYFVGNAQVVAKVMVTTTMSAAAGGLSTLILGTALDYRETGEFVILIEHLNNGVLAGLVGVTAGCAVVEPYGACIIGLGASFVYVYSAKLLLKYGIDDVVEAVPIHGCCGCYGVIMASLLATKSNYKAAYGIYEGAEDTCAGLLYGGKFNGVAAALCFCLFVFLWTGVCSCVVFGGLKYFNLIRVSDAAEEDGADKEIEIYIIPTFAITFSTSNSHASFQLAFSDKSHLQVFPEGKGKAF
jgi:Amt family ammonium transporter